MKYIYCCIWLLLLFGCNSKNDFSKEYMANYPNLYEKEISLPKAIKRIDGTIYIQEPENKKVYIYSVIDGNCASCISNIVEWQKLLLEDKYNKYINIVFISPVVIPDQIKQFVIQEKIELTILEDPKCEFIYNNGLEDLLYNIYITNKEHKIKLVGNPYKDPILYRHYRKLLKSR